jgi:NADH dehydrogenase
MAEQPQSIRVVIVGGGFAGIMCALRVSHKLPTASIELISDRPHFEFTSSLHRVVTGHSPLEVCLPLREIFEGTRVRVTEDSIVDTNFANREVIGASGSHYRYDYLVLALGAENNYFNIPGVEEGAMTIKSIADALRLKRHLHTILSRLVMASHEVLMPAGHVVVVGGGPTGVELAGELAAYVRELALRHGVDPSIVTVDLVEAGPRILSRLPEDMARAILQRLRSLGVNIYCNRAVEKIEDEKIFLGDVKIEAETIVWTAGVAPHHLYRSFRGLTLDEKGRVKVDPYLRASGQERVFIAGDAAATPYAGMAQTAIVDGKTVGSAIVRLIRGEPPQAYQPKAPSYAIPLGDGWAAVLYHGFRLYGLFGWMLRRAADLRFFLSILPVRKAFVAFMSGWRLSESCPVCSDNEYYVGELDERSIPSDERAVLD